MKEGEVVILANSKWDSGGFGGNSSQQYARTFLKMGWRVSYVEPSGTWRIESPGASGLNPNRIVMCDFPYVELFKELFNHLGEKGFRRVCRIVDHWKSINVDEQFNPDLEPQFIREAEVVFASSPLNVKRLSRLRPDIKLLRNGVDLDHFNFKESDHGPQLSQGRINLGVVASFWIARWIQLQPLIRYAEHHFQDIVHVIGKPDGRFQELLKLDNVILHGPKHWNDLPGFVSRFDVGVVPYSAWETRYTNPIKVLEYLACGKPVVSCYNGSIDSFPYVYFHDGERSFEKAIERAVSIPINKERLREFLKENSWQDRIHTIISCLWPKGKRSIDK
jgi:glycosyltransferase involved in cell wall biosynthesis